jgi:hypothetical protein
MNTRTRPWILTACAAAGLVSTACGQNLVVNGNFESGNTGFVSDYSFTAGGNCCEGQYTVRQLPNTFNGAFVNPPPASPGSVRMMIVNGALTPNLRVWSQTVPVIPGRTYRIGLSACTAVVGGPAILAFRVNSQPVGAPLTLEDRTGIWTQLESTWTADAAAATLVIADLNTSRFPNDFYIDDISMEEVINPCAADFNQDGGVDGADVGAFFAAWEQGDAVADVNSDGGVDGSDVEAFFAQWEAGGC